MHAECESFGTHERDMLENKEEKSDDDHIQQNSSCDNNPARKGVISTMHGNRYQIKLFMLFLQTALNKKERFELHFEKEDAGKFDDITFNDIDKDVGQHRFVQVKHKLDPKKDYITIEKLLSTSPKTDFNLQKYFISFRKIQENPQYKNKIKDYIIYTNADFYNNIRKKNRLIKQEEEDDILEYGERYKLIFNENNKDIIEKLKASDINRLAYELAKAFTSEEKCLNLHNEPLKAYYIEEIFDKKSDKENKWYYTFKKNFKENPSIKHLRDAIEREVKKRKSNTNLWDTLNDTKFNISFKFEEHATDSSAKTNLPNDFIDDDEIEKFFEKLVFTVKQPNEKELHNLIQSKILNSLDLKDNDLANMIYKNVLKEMENRLNNSKSIVLTNQDDLFKTEREKIKRVTYVNEYKRYIKELNIEFNNTSEEVQKLSNSISTFLNSGNKIFNLISSKKNISLTEVEVCQIKQQSIWNLKRIVKMHEKDKAENLFSNNLLIIVCRNESEIKHEQIEGLYDELVQSIKKDDNRKIILITKNNSNLALKFFEGDLKNNYNEQKLCQIRIRDLDENYLRQQLGKMGKKITFQGQKRNIADLLNIDNELNNCEFSEILETLEKVLKCETLSEFIFNKNIVVGNKLYNWADDNSPYYDPYYIDIPRTFSHQIIDENSLKKCINERKGDLFAFPFTMKDHLNILVSEEENNIKVFSEITDNISDEEFFEEAMFFILSRKDPETDFNKLCNKYNGKNIHWLTSINEKNNKFKVKYSNRLSNLQEFMKLENLGTEIECSSRVIIIGDPGVGKSTILTTYFQQINKQSWPIRINLKDHQEYIKTANFDSINKIVKFLCRSSPKNFKNALAKSLLKYYLSDRDQIILLLDGYDEITNDNQDKVIELLRSFPANNKIWLTTRSNQQYKIENALGNASSYFLNPFNEEEQEKFLNEYWIKKLNIKESDEKEQDNIGKFTKKLLEHFHQIGLMTSENLVGIVLQARMIADTCLKYYEEFNKHNSLKFEINNISDLYEKFIEYQYERYFTKIEIDKKSSYNNLRVVLKTVYSEIHGYFALNVLFPRDQLSKVYLINQIYREFPKDILNDIGLVKNVEENYFVHFTYAEYFVSKLLVNTLGKSKDHLEYKLVYEFLLKNIFLNRNKLICDFFKHEIKKRWDNNDVNSKWEEIEKCNLLTEIESNGILKITLPFVDDDTDDDIEIPNNNAESNKTLDELRKNVESCIEKIPNGDDDYYYYGDTELINKLFQKFLEETDIKKLESTFKFLIKKVPKILIKINGELYLYYRTNEQFLRNDNMDFAVIHYLSQVRLQKNRNIKNIEKMILDNIKVISRSSENLTLFIDLLKELSKPKYENQTQNIMTFLIPRKIKITEFVKLNYQYYYVNKFNENIINDINSNINFQKVCIEKIIKFLENVKFPKKWNFDSDIDIITDTDTETDFIHLQSLFIEITHHPNIIACTKRYINEIFHNRCQQSISHCHWLERQGILLSIFLKILTPEMSKIFNSELDILFGGVTEVYCRRILFHLISYIVNKMAKEDLPQIDKLAFLKMIVKFCNKQIEYVDKLPFNLNQIETTLKLVENILKEEHEPVFEVVESVEYLYTLKKIGLLLINIADQKILVLDPEGQLQFELSSNYKDQIIELLQWKYENHEEPEDEDIKKEKNIKFIKKCYEIVETKKCDLKKSNSESRLQELNKHYIE